MLNRSQLLGMLANAAKSEDIKSMERNFLVVADYLEEEGDIRADLVRFHNKEMIEYFHERIKTNREEYKNEWHIGYEKTVCERRGISVEELRKEDEIRTEKNVMDQMVLEAAKLFSPERRCASEQKLSDEECRARITEMLETGTHFISILGEGDKMGNGKPRKNFPGDEVMLFTVNKGNFKPAKFKWFIICTYSNGHNKRFGSINHFYLLLRSDGRVVKRSTQSGMFNFSHWERQNQKDQNGKVLGSTK